MDVGREKKRRQCYFLSHTDWLDDVLPVRNTRLPIIANEPSISRLYIAWQTTSLGIRLPRDEIADSFLHQAREASQVIARDENASDCQVVMLRVAQQFLRARTADTWCHPSSQPLLDFTTLYVHRIETSSATPTIVSRFGYFFFFFETRENPRQSLLS